MSELNEVLKIEPEEIQENEAMVTYDIATYPSDFTLNGIVEMWKNKDICIPEFQREYVWDIRQASLLIESFFLGLPVPPVFFYIDEENKNLVIDGQQRILSTVFYFEGLFGFVNLQGTRKVFRLQGLNEKSPYHNKLFSELTEADQRKLKNTVLRAINIRQISPKNDRSSVYHIFERLNTGGTPLTPQEIRNVVYRGNLVKELKTLNENSDWRKIVGLKGYDKHQKDVELVLRILGLGIDVKKYAKPMKDFLNTTMFNNKNAESDYVTNFIADFPKATAIIVKLFGEKPFHLRGPLNTSALDSVFCTILKYLNRLPENLYERYKLLKDNSQFRSFTTMGTTDEHTIQARFELVENILIK